MKVWIRDIPRDGELTLSHRFSTEDMVAGWSLRQDAQDALTQGLGLSARLSEQGDGYLLLGELAGQILPTCSRCLETFDCPLKVELSVFIVEKPEGADGDTLEEGSFFYEGRDIDISRLCSEQLDLQWPMVWTCDESCQGLCPDCGESLNLGDHSCTSASDTRRS